MKELMIKAMKSNLQAKYDKALATLNNYLENPVAIGEHPDLVNEALLALDKLDDASGKIKTLDDILEKLQVNIKL